MYFPTLIARGSELLALRSLISRPDFASTLVPVLEPVNANVSQLRRCLLEIGEAKAQAVVIVNPSQHELGTGVATGKFRKDINDLFTDYPTLLPGYRCSAKTTQKDIDLFNKLYKTDVAFLYANSALSDVEARAVATIARAQYHIVFQDRISRAQKSVLPKEKLVEVRDGFNKQKKNGDYSGTEFFSDQYKTFSTTAVGFGDYTTVGEEFKPGGGPPSAVAIHATFKNPKTADIWIEHFVSDDVDPAVGDVGGKFLQAAAKLSKAAKKRPAEFGDNDALDCYYQYVNAAHYPGLGKNKEHQIAHHAALVLDLISGKL
jgi:hypothetical protein